MSDKKQPKVHRRVIVLLIVLTAVLLFPWNTSAMTDGGTIEFESLFGIYDITKWHAATGGGEFIDGTHYSYSPFRMRYRIGTTVKLFGHVVYDHTYYDQPAEPMKYEEEVKALIDHYNSHRINDVELRSISVSNYGGDSKYIYLAFLEVDRIEVSDDIVKYVLDYLEKNPDCFLNGDYRLRIAARHTEVISKTETTETLDWYEAEYSIDPGTKTINELYLSPLMIPESVPSERNFVKVKRIELRGNKINEKQEQALRMIYPDSEIVYR